MTCVPGHFGEWLQGRLGPDGPLALVTLACPDRGVRVTRTPGPFALTGDPVFADQYDRAAWPAQTKRLTALFAEHPVRHWAALFGNSDACVAPVLTPWEAAKDPHIAARAIWHEAEGTLQPAPAPRFDGQAPTPNPTPKRGQHTDEIIADLRNRGLV